MKQPIISSNFDVDDIRKIRDYNSSRHRSMTPEEIIADTRAATSDLIEMLVRQNPNGVRVISNFNTSIAS